MEKPERDLKPSLAFCQSLKEESRMKIQKLTEKWRDVKSASSKKTKRYKAARSKYIESMALIKAKMADKKCDGFKNKETVQLDKISKVIQVRIWSSKNPKVC